MSRWFRFYDEVLDDPKAQRLEPELFKVWVNLLCLASRNNGQLPKVDDIAFALRSSVTVTERNVTALTEAGLFDEIDGVLKPHNWGGRQYKSDSEDTTNALRQKRFREKHRNGNRNAVTPVTVTATRTDTEQNRERPRKRATRLPDDWAPSSADRDFAKSLGFSDQAIDHHAARFKDFWAAKPGAGGTKLDWSATWRNWMRTEATNLAKTKSKDDWRNPLAGIV